ncbi:MAG: CDGSH iron-sulfur domain-containing protein, partial [Candidatus Eremiobacteraeota bacterium]|nr:CDGSH iron-sulfur domain-containing protein [Candidatus Eremiobacteraeota bacterium]
APHFRRPNFPLPPEEFPFGIRLSLEPFSQETIERFVCYEMPEAGILSAEQQALFDPLRARVLESQGALQVSLEEENEDYESFEPFEVDFKTVGEFYHKIRTGFEGIPEDQLFIGPPEAQAKAKYLDLEGSLIAVVDRDSACRAIEMIVEQGEAPTKEHPDAHFVVFDSIRREFEELTHRAVAGGRTFEPVRPVVSNPMTRYFDERASGTLIDDPFSHEVADLFNTAYDTMLLMLLRFFAHTEENEEELRMLARGTLRLMASVLRPLAEALMKMPAGTAHPGKTAGPGFGYNRDVHLLAHKGSAWIFFLERLWELAGRTTQLAQADNVPQEIAEAAAALEAVAEYLMPYVPTEFAQRIKTVKCAGAAEAAIRPEFNGPYLVMNLHSLTNSQGETLLTRPVVALCRCGGSALKPYCDGTHARIGYDSSKSPERTPDRLDTYAGKEITVRDNRGTCCHFGNCTDHLPAVFHHEGDVFATPDSASKEEIIDIVRACPSGALGYSVNGETYAGEQREPSIFVSHNGPYYVRGGIKLQNTQRNEGALLEHYALCRCGHSRNKPFCDGTHWWIKFTDEEN